MPEVKLSLQEDSLYYFLSWQNLQTPLETGAPLHDVLYRHLLELSCSPREFTNEYFSYDAHKIQCSCSVLQNYPE